MVKTVSDPTTLITLSKCEPRTNGPSRDGIRPHDILAAADADPRRLGIVTMNDKDGHARARGA